MEIRTFQPWEKHGTVAILVVGSVIAREDKLHVIQCPNPKTVQSWEASLEKLWEWMKSQNT